MSEEVKKKVERNEQEEKENKRKWREKQDQ